MAWGCGTTVQEWCSAVEHVTDRGMWDHCTRMVQHCCTCDRQGDVGPLYMNGAALLYMWHGDVGPLYMYGAALLYMWRGGGGCGTAMHVWYSTIVYIAGGMWDHCTIMVQHYCICSRGMWECCTRMVQRCCTYG